MLGMKARVTVVVHPAGTQINYIDVESDMFAASIETKTGITYSCFVTETCDN